MRNNDMLTAAEIRMLLKEDPNTDQKKKAENAGENNPRKDEEEEEDEYEKMDPKPFAGKGGMICV